MTPNPAETATSGWTPRIVKPCPETEALARFLWNGTWTGTVEADGMGPGSPEMVGRGSAKVAWILDDLWLCCHFEQDQYVLDQKVLTWRARWIIGWDVAAGEYRAVGVDNNGVAFIFRGDLLGDQLVMESLGEGPMKLRFTWDARDPGAVTWKNEMSVGSGPWSLIEEYVMTPD